MVSTTRALTKVDVYISFVLSADVEDAWDLMRDFGHAPWWNKAGNGEFRVLKLKGRSTTELGSGRVFNIGSGRLFEKLTAIDDDKRKLSWMLVSHPQTISPFGQASFVNYNSKLRMYPVSVTSQTFLEWKGSFLTEPEHANMMETVIANWYFAGMQALQNYLAFRTSKPDIRQLPLPTAQPAAVSPQSSVPVAPPVTASTTFRSHDEESVQYRGNLNQDLEFMPGSRSWSGVGRVSNPDPSSISTPSSPNTASAHNARLVPASSSESSDGSQNTSSYGHHSQHSAPSRRNQRGHTYGEQSHHLQPIAEGAQCLQAQHKRLASSGADSRSSSFPISLPGSASTSSMSAVMRKAMPRTSDMETDNAHQRRFRSAGTDPAPICLHESYNSLARHPHQLTHGQPAGDLHQTYDVCLDYLRRASSRLSDSVLHLSSLSSIHSFDSPGTPDGHSHNQDMLHTTQACLEHARAVDMLSQQMRPHQRCSTTASDRGIHHSHSATDVMAAAKRSEQDSQYCSAPPSWAMPKPQDSHEMPQGQDSHKKGLARRSGSTTRQGSSRPRPASSIDGPFTPQNSGGLAPCNNAPTQNSGGRSSPPAQQGSGQEQSLHSQVASLNAYCQQASQQNSQLLASSQCTDDTFDGMDMQAWASEDESGRRTVVPSERSSLDDQVAALQERHELMHKASKDAYVCASPFAQPMSPFQSSFV